MENKNGNEFEILAQTGSDKFRHKLVLVEFIQTGYKTEIRKNQAESGDIVDKSQDDIVGKTFTSKDGEYEVICIDHRDEHYNKYYKIKFLESGNEHVVVRHTVVNGRAKDKFKVVGNTFSTNKDQEFEVLKAVGDSRYLCYFPESNDFTAARKNQIKRGAVNPHRTLYYKDGRLNSISLKVIQPDDWEFSGLDPKGHPNLIKLWNGLRFVKRPSEVTPQLKDLAQFKKLVPEKYIEMKYLDVPVAPPRRTTLEVKPKDLGFSLTN